MTAASDGVAADPRDAVREWWHAMQHGETETLARLAAEDYLQAHHVSMGSA